MEKECELTKGKKNDFERIEWGEIVRSRNKIKIMTAGSITMTDKERLIKVERE